MLVMIAILNTECTKCLLADPIATHLSLQCWCMVTPMLVRNGQPQLPFKHLSHLKLLHTHAPTTVNPEIFRVIKLSC